MNAEYLAASRAYNAARRYLRDQGWDPTFMRSADRSKVIDIYQVTIAGEPVTEMAIRHYWSESGAYTVPFMFRPTSVQHAIDFLVDAKVLPDQFHRLTAKPATDPCPRCTHAVGGHDQQGCTDEDCSCPLPNRAAAWLARKYSERVEVALVEIGRQTVGVAS